MRLLKRSRANRFTQHHFSKWKNGAGFTLVEMLIVLALVALLASFGLVVGIDSYQRSTFRGEGDVLAAMLQKARSRALANIGQCNHGVRFTEDSYTLFAEDDGVCDTQSAAGETTNLEGAVIISGPDAVVFVRLSGNARTGGGDAVIILTDPNAPANAAVRVTVGENGRIAWE